MLRTILTITAVLSFIALCSAQVPSPQFKSATPAEEAYITVYVPDDYPTIQGAINAVPNKTRIIVRPGTYYENINFFGKAIHLVSEQGSNLTVIDGNSYDSAVVFCNGEWTDSILEGFAITNGYAACGGAVYCWRSSPTIRNNVIDYNTAVLAGGGIYCGISQAIISANDIQFNNTLLYNGGGVFCTESSLLIDNNVISDNTSYEEGGGISFDWHSDGTIRNNTIENNHAREGGGGGIYCDNHSSPVICDNMIYMNVSDTGGGGGICCDDSSNATIDNNQIIDNQALDDAGGGIFCWGSTTIISNNLITDNFCDEVGGGISCDDGSNATVQNNIILWNTASGGGGVMCDNSSPVITNNLICENTASYGSGIWCSASSSVIENNTVAGNLIGDGILVTSRPEYPLSEPNIRNTIVWDHTADWEINVADFFGTPSALTISYSDVDGGQFSVNVDPGCTLNWGPGMIGDLIIHDPLFVNGPQGDFYLSQIPPQSSGHSPCVDTGDPASAMITGTTRTDDVQDSGVVDMGYHYRLMPPGMAYIPAGEFEMGDHHDGMSNALPVHTVYVDAFAMDVYEVTNQQYCDYLNSAYGQGLIEVMLGMVYKAGDTEPYCAMYSMGEYNRIQWDGNVFWITTGKEMHPMLMVSWYGAVAYANWRSVEDGLSPCYDLDTWECSFGAGGYRLPTEAEWEYAARGGEHNPYYRYPWGDSIDGSKANYSQSGDPYETGDYPWTTPVGYYDGNQTPPGVDMANGHGLYDMAGNVREWCNDWFDTDYYNHSPYNNPHGPGSGSSRVLRNGAWFTTEYGLRCAYRDGNGYGYLDSISGFRLVLD